MAVAEVPPLAPIMAPLGTVARTGAWSLKRIIEYSAAWTPKATMMGTT
jgi:hypothetical protein